MPASSSPIDSHALETFTRGDKQLQILLVETMLTEAPEAMKEINRLLQNQDWKGLYREMHKLKPNVEMMGMVEVAPILNSLNNDLRLNRNLEAVPARTGKMLDALAGALEALRRQYPV